MPCRFPPSAGLWNGRVLILPLPSRVREALAAALRPGNGRRDSVCVNESPSVATLAWQTGLPRERFILGEPPSVTILLAHSRVS